MENKTNVQEIFESVKLGCIVTKEDENTFLVQQQFSRNGHVLMFNTEADLEHAAIYPDMDIYNAVFPFVADRVYPDIVSQLEITEDEKNRRDCFCALFTEEELDAIVGFYTSHEKFEEGAEFLKTALL